MSDENTIGWEEALEMIGRTTQRLRGLLEHTRKSRAAEAEQNRELCNEVQRLRRELEAAQTAAKACEILRWTKIDPEHPGTLPDDDTTVLGYAAGWDKPIGCYIDAGVWMSEEGHTLRSDKGNENLRPPTHWTDWPQGPTEE